MNLHGKHMIAVAGASLALLVGAASAAAAIQAGPPASAPHAGLQQNGLGGVMAGGVVMDAAAAYIGISEDALAAARHDGKSLAQIATANGKTVAGLEAALVAAFQTNLDKAVAAGRITAAQAAQALANFKAQVDTVVSRTATGPLNGNGRGHGHGNGMGMGTGQCRR